MKNATTTSNNEIEEVTAARNISTKNRRPKICPNGIESNTDGKVINIKLGPAPGSKPKAKTAGKTAKPAAAKIKPKFEAH